MTANICGRTQAELRCAELAPERRLFFKYMTRDVAKIVLSNRTLRWTTPGTFNDPFDVQFDLDVRANFERVQDRYVNAFWDKHFAAHPKHGERWEGTAAALREAYAKGIDNLRAMLPQTNAELRALMAREKIICFSETPFSIPMWAYYAEQHQGAVLCFRCIPGGDSPYRIAQPVRYREEMPQLYEEEELFRALTREYSLKGNQAEIVDRLVYTKAIAWEHEREWRIRQGDGRNPDAVHEDNSFDPRELAAVLLGCRMPESDRAELSGLAKVYPSAEVYQMERAAKVFELRMSPARALF